jgi:hypothetical protein
MNKWGDVFRRHELPLRLPPETGELDLKLRRLYRWKKSVPMEDLDRLMDVLSKAPPDKLWEALYCRPYSDRRIRVILGSYGAWYVPLAFYTVKGQDERLADHGTADN